ncbi:MAG TPA: hemolysin family protein [Longimicrobiales bacterium]|nr:hemolysin family protein [Longimicrobiales bacterium]
MITPILIIFLLIALNGLFVAAEFAIVGVSRAELANLRRERRSSVRLARWILGDPRRQDRFIATAQLGITAASLGLGMYGEHIVAEWIMHALDQRGWVSVATAHTIASILAVTVLTYFHIVLGEMVPKSLALSHARATVLWIAPIMRGVQLVFYPLVVGLNGLGNGLLRMFGVDRTRGGHEQYRTPEEIAFIVRESEAGGLLRRESAQVVSELLDFGDLTAGEVMVPRVRVVGIPMGATSDMLRTVLRTAPHTRYPVFEGTLDHILGMCHVREFMRSAEGYTLATEALRPVPFVPETAKVDQVLAAMREQKVQMAVVMDEHGGTAGIVTMEDLFEEVVGDITERVGEKPEIAKQPDGSLQVDGGARIEDVGDALGVVLEHDEVATVSGLVLAILGRPPALGDEVVYDHVRFQVTAVRGHGVGAARVTPVEQQPASE